jgi:DNA-binding GntR family transcriptional regulator
MAEDGDLVFEFDRTSTVDQVADRMRMMIWRGQLQPGFRLKEMPLSKSFGVSRNTIRDAIRDLAQDGLLTHELHRGAIVRELGAEDVADLYAVLPARPSWRRWARRW